MADFKLTPAREKELEKLAKDLPDNDFKKRYGKDWKSVKIATAMNMLKKKYGFKEDKMKFKDLREKYKSKFPPSLVAAAVKIALDMGGNMTGAYKKIERMKKGLGDDPVVMDALRLANEEYNMRETNEEVDDDFIDMMNNMMKHKHGSPAFKKAKQEIEDYMSKKHKKKVRFANDRRRS